MPCGLQAVMRAAAVEEKIYVATSWLGVQVLDLTSYSGTWKTAGKMERDAIGQLHVEAVAVNPNNPQEVWAGRRSPGLGKGQGLLYSNDGGDNWVAVSVAGMPLFSIWSLAVSPFDETLYVGTWYGTFTFTPQKGLSGKTGK